MRTPLWLLTVGLVACQSPPPAALDAPIVGSEATPHIAQAKAPGDRDAAPIPSIEELVFMVGTFTGEAFGGWVEESWSAPKGGTMIGHFRLVNDEGPAFYELMVIAEVDGRPTLRVKHFHADMTPWEEGAECVDFPLLKVEGTTAWFGGLTFHRSGNSAEIFVAMNSNGELSEERMSLTRVR